MHEIDTVVRDYTQHSPYTAPGAQSDWLEDAPTTVAGIRRLVSGLVFHYRAAGDPAYRDFAAPRLDEIDLRYASAILGRLRELQPDAITAERSLPNRVLGCCRDFTLLFVTLARQAGIPARMRVGFAGYFVDGWGIDHVVAEVWDAAEGRWMLVEPQVDDGFVDAVTNAPLDLLDVPRDRFLVGADAWRLARTGAIDHDRFVVEPQNPTPFLRSWPYLEHNLAVDLAALNGCELVLWDAWGPLEELTDPARPSFEVSGRRLAELDELAMALSAATRPDASPAESARAVAEVYTSSDFVVPDSVLTLSPLGYPPRRTLLSAS